jgi:hypothetical protein
MYVRKQSALVEDRALRGGGGVGIRDRGLLCVGLGGEHTGLFVGSEFG